MLLIDIAAWRNLAIFKINSIKNLPHVFDPIWVTEVFAMARTLFLHALNLRWGPFLSWKLIFYREWWRWPLHFTITNQKIIINSFSWIINSFSWESKSSTSGKKSLIKESTDDLIYSIEPHYSKYRYVRI